ncbi:MAG: class I SAM-dependent methyltransferase [Pseudomonadota bacterium]
MIDPSRYPNLAALHRLQLSVFPGHQSYLERRFAGVSEPEMAELEALAILIDRIAQDRRQSFAEHYAWLSEMVLAEELHFRRTGSYRLSRFEDALATVYADTEFMGKYMDGLLMSLLWWENHSRAISFYRREFLATLPAGARHLEIGPGHGLLLYMASDSPAGELTGWDVSETSLAHTRSALEAMGVTTPITLEAHNIYAAPEAHFDSITFSEVLEHLERPAEALAILRGLLKPGGRLYVHAPVNSPAPDHLYLFETPEAIVDIIAAAGFQIRAQGFFPAMGATLERARRLKLAISTVAVAEAI